MGKSCFGIEDTAMTKPRDPEDEFEPAVLRQMKIDPIELPDPKSFQPRFLEEDLVGVEDGLLPVLRSLNILDQKMNLVMTRQVDQNTQMRVMEADGIRARMNNGVQKAIQAAKWAGSAFVGGLIVAFAKGWVDKMWK